MSKVYEDVYVVAKNRRVNLTRRDVSETLDAFIEHITANMVDGQDITVPRLGTFKAIDIPERTQRNPRTQAPVVVAAHRVVRFSPSNTLTTLVWGNEDNDE